MLAASIRIPPTTTVARIEPASCALALGFGRPSVEVALDTPSVSFVRAGEARLSR